MRNFNFLDKAINEQTISVVVQSDNLQRNDRDYDRSRDSDRNRDNDRGRDSDWNGNNSEQDISGEVLDVYNVDSIIA